MKHGSNLSTTKAYAKPAVSLISSFDVVKGKKLESGTDDSTIHEMLRRLASNKTHVTPPVDNPRSPVISSIRVTIFVFHFHLL